MKAKLFGGPAHGKTVDVDTRYPEIMWPVFDEITTMALERDIPVPSPRDIPGLPPPTFRAARYHRKPDEVHYYYTGNLEE